MHRTVVSATKKGPFHEGEIAVQERAGVRDIAARVGRSLHPLIERDAAAFLGERVTLYVGSLDARGRPWATQLVGPPGFVRVPDVHTVWIAAEPAPGDPLRENLAANPAVGLLALRPETRHRYRVNGDARVETGRITVRVREAFGNCPKFIHPRTPVSHLPTPAATAVRRGVALTPEQRALIAASDTFFLATAHRSAGADLSHRGGDAGFVRVVDDRTLVWPDYAGNMMFQSLGNLAEDPRAGLLFVDFDGGRMLELTGEARVDWDPARAATFRGAERTIELRIDEALELPDGNPLRWRDVAAVRR